jgi:hypothetical protein
VVLGAVLKKPRKSELLRIVVDLGGIICCTLPETRQQGETHGAGKETAEEIMQFSSCDRFKIPVNQSSNPGGMRKHYTYPPAALYNKLK